MVNFSRLTKPDLEYLGLSKGSVKERKQFIKNEITKLGIKSRDIDLFKLPRQLAKSRHSEKVAREKAINESKARSRERREANRQRQIEANKKEWIVYAIIEYATGIGIMGDPQYKRSERNANVIGCKVVRRTGQR